MKFLGDSGIWQRRLDKLYVGTQFVHKFSGAKGSEYAISARRVWNENLSIITTTLLCIGSGVGRGSGTTLL